MHKDDSIDKNHKKKRPETVEYCNKTKAGVYVLDQTSRYHTCKSATRRWPVACFFNIIDCACINAFIVYKEVTKSSISRRQLLLELVKELCRYNKIAEPKPTSNRKCSDQWRRYPLNLVDKSKGGKLLGAAKCHNILKEQRQSH